VTSVTGRFVKKAPNFCPNIAQNGALVNKNFCPNKNLGILRQKIDQIYSFLGRI
jgi:hypothetical protein